MRVHLIGSLVDLFRGPLIAAQATNVCQNWIRTQAKTLGTNVLALLQWAYALIFSLNKILMLLPTHTSETS